MFGEPQWRGPLRWRPLLHGRYATLLCLSLAWSCVCAVPSSNANATTVTFHSVFLFLHHVFCMQQEGTPSMHMFAPAALLSLMSLMAQSCCVRAAWTVWQSILCLESLSGVQIGCCAANRATCIIDTVKNKDSIVLYDFIGTMITVVLGVIHRRHTCCTGSVWSRVQLDAYERSDALPECSRRLLPAFPNE